MYDILQLNDMLVPELLDIAEQLQIPNAKKLDKQEMIYKILDQQAVSSSGPVENPADKGKRKRIVKVNTANTANSAEEAEVINEVPAEQAAPEAKEKIQPVKRGRKVKAKDGASGNDTQQEPDGNNHNINNDHSNDSNPGNNHNNDSQQGNAPATEEVKLGSILKFPEETPTEKPQHQIRQQQPRREPAFNI